MISRKEYDYDIAGLVDGQTEIHQEMLRNWKATCQWVNEAVTDQADSNDLLHRTFVTNARRLRYLEDQVTMNRRLLFKMQENAGLKGLLRRAWKYLSNLHWHSPGIGPRR